MTTCKDCGVAYSDGHSDTHTCTPKNTKTGVVTWFNDSKGFGFIKPDGGGRDVFVHWNNIADEGFKTLPEGGRVELEVLTDGDGRLVARNVRKIK